MTTALSRVGGIVVRQFYLIRGSFARAVPLFVWVAIDIVLWGFITRYLDSMQALRFSLVPILLGAVLLWDFFTRVMQGVTIAFLEDVWSRNFLSLFASPLGVGEYIAGLVFTSIATSGIGLAVMLLLATLGFGLSFANLGGLLLPFLLILFLFGIAMGIAGCAMVLRMGPASEWFVWPIPALLSPFAGVFYPIATLPEPMQWIAYALPPAYVFEGMRAAILDETFDARLLAVGAALALVYIGLAAAWFMAMFRYAVRTGLLARYSAESTG